MVSITYGVARAALSAITPDAGSKGFWARFYDAIVKSRMLQAERDVAAYRRFVLSQSNDDLALTRRDLPFAGE